MKTCDNGKRNLEKCFLYGQKGFAHNSMVFTLNQTYYLNSWWLRIMLIHKVDACINLKKILQLGYIVLLLDTVAWVRAIDQLSIELS
jgi:hypothetical protein